MLTFVHLLPLALALAFSTVPILAAFLILLSPNRSRSALPFLIGLVGGLFLVSVAATLGAQFVPSSILPGREAETIGRLEIVVGAALILVGLFTLWRARRKKSREVPGWLRSVGTLGPFSSFGLGFVLNLRPKSLLLAVAVGLTVRADTGSTVGALVAIAVYTAIGASTVAVPIVATLVSPARTEPRLETSRDWLLRNGEAITSIIVIVVGALIIWIGFTRF